MGQDSISILRSPEEAPDGALIVQRYNERLADEARRRAMFLNDVDETSKTEFINGAIIVHAPATLARLRAVGNFYAMLRGFVVEHDLGMVLSEKAMIHLTRNDYEPDLCYFSKEKTAKFTDDQTLFPAPDLVVEVISPSTAKIDRGVKFIDYAAHGVWEYWLVDPKKKTVEQYGNLNGKFELIMKSGDGEMRSSAVPGFVLRVGEVFK